MKTHFYIIYCDATFSGQVRNSHPKTFELLPPLSSLQISDGKFLERDMINLKIHKIEMREDTKYYITLKRFHLFPFFKTICFEYREDLKDYFLKKTGKCYDFPGPFRYVKWVINYSLYCEDDF